MDFEADWTSFVVEAIIMLILGDSAA